MQTQSWQTVIFWNFRLSRGQPSETFSLPPANSARDGKVGDCLFLTLNVLWCLFYTKCLSGYQTLPVMVLIKPHPQEHSDWVCNIFPFFLCCYEAWLTHRVHDLVGVGVVPESYFWFPINKFFRDAFISFKVWPQVWSKR